jgi:ubiquinone/menaquinone biosynthesis C-methylase UbiE
LRAPSAPRPRSSSIPEFDRYAEEYDAAVEQVIGASGEDVAYFARIKAELSARFVASPPGRVLDFGCGIGNTTAALAGSFPGSRITGCDVSPASIVQANRLRMGDPRLDFVAFEGALPFPGATFDLAFTACVFHHIARAEQLHWARELRRVVAPGGALLVFEHNPYNPLTRKVVRDCVFDRGVSLLRPGYARTLLASAGFRAESPRFYFFFPHALAFLRPLERLLSWCPIGAQYFVRGT